MNLIQRRCSNGELLKIAIVTRIQRGCAAYPCAQRLVQLVIIEQMTDEFSPER